MLKKKSIFQILHTCTSANRPGNHKSAAKSSVKCLYNYSRYFFIRYGWWFSGCILEYRLFNCWTIKNDERVIRCDTGELRRIAIYLAIKLAKSREGEPLVTHIRIVSIFGMHLHSDAEQQRINVGRNRIYSQLINCVRLRDFTKSFGKSPLTLTGSAWILLMLHNQYSLWYFDQPLECISSKVKCTGNGSVWKTLSNKGFS